MRISICMPVYNMQNTIIRAIESVVNQLTEETELIIVDNCSTDNTFALAEGYKSDRVTVQKNEFNVGAYNNHNICMKLSNGEWIKFLHGDDVMLSGGIKKILSDINVASNDIDLIAYSARHIDAKEKSHLIVHQRRVLLPENDVSILLSGNLFGTPSMVLFKRSCATLYGIFDPRFEPGSDYDAWLHFLTKSKVYFSDFILVEIYDDHIASNRQRERLMKKWLLHTNFIFGQWYDKLKGNNKNDLQLSRIMKIQRKRYLIPAIKLLLVGRPKLLIDIVRGYTN